MKLRWAVFVVLLAAMTTSAALVLFSNSPTYEVPAVESGTEIAESVDEDVPDACQNASYCNMQQVVAAAASIGAEAALAQYHALAEQYPELQSACHYHYETIGRAITLANGLVDHRESGCQFGYLHGVLYAVGEMYEDGVESLTADLVAYCLGYLDDGSVSSPRSNCNHGIGHALAEVSQDDPMVALTACAAVAGDPRNCADGVLMEYGDDHLKRVGFLNTTSGSEDRETYVDARSMRELCADVPQYAEYVCFARLWKFTVVGPLERAEDVAIANTVCDAASSLYLQEGCHEGFGELVTNIPTPEVQWPPENAFDADTKARSVAKYCMQMDLPGSCLTGAIPSMNSHLYAVDIEEYLIPNPCKYVTVSYVPACTAAMDRARALNWNKTATADASQS